MTIVRIPADVEIPDRVLGPLTARQLAIIAGTGGVLYGIWSLARPLVPVGVFVALATPIVIVAVTVALGHRDGISLDRMLLAAMRQRTSPRHHTTSHGDDAALDAPPWLTTNSAPPPGGSHTRGRRRAAGSPDGFGSPVPARSVEPGIGEIGVVDLGTDGLAVIAVAAPVNLVLRTPTEQDALVATFARYLHGLTAPVQILVRTEHLDLRRQINDLRDSAAQLPHPALEAAALEHADYLTQLGAQNMLLRRQVLLVLREPRATHRSEQSGHGSFAAGSSWWPPRREHEAGWSEHARRAAESRLTGRLTEAVDILAAAGIVVTPLDAAQATTVLAVACDPGRTPAPSGAAGADDVVTTPRRRPDDGVRAAYRDQRRPGETEQRDDGWADPDDRFADDDDLDRIDRGGSRIARRRGWR